ncbi:MAG: glycosyltransferase family 2 protein [Patescibacteria group bacterium]
MKLSITIAAYNEQNTILRCLESVSTIILPNGFEKEIIIVDDASTDKTKEILDTVKGKYKVFHHEKNRGKGSAIRTGISKATGDYIVMQDADMELNPNDLSKMLKKMLDENLTVLYGSRWLGKEQKDYSRFSFYLGGVFLSILINVLYSQNITDMLTCYKMFKSDFLKSLPLKSERFEYEAEVTVLTALRGVKIKEFPISYFPRSIAEGKKIRWHDGFKNAQTIIKHRFI